MDGQPIHCQSCGALIDPRFADFGDCTKCAVEKNNAACEEWRAEQRERARERITNMLAKRAEENDDGFANNRA